MLGISGLLPPLRDVQLAAPAALCPLCGGELYRGDPALRRSGGPVCLRCLCRRGLERRRKKKEERAHARALDFRICQLQAVLERTENEDQRLMLNERIHMLSIMLREARELAVLTERYYERGYRRNAKYTL